MAGKPPPFATGYRAPPHHCAEDDDEEEEDDDDEDEDDDDDAALTKIEGCPCCGATSPFDLLLLAHIYHFFAFNAYSFFCISYFFFAEVSPLPV